MRAVAGRDVVVASHPEPDAARPGALRLWAAGDLLRLAAANAAAWRSRGRRRGASRRAARTGRAVARTFRLALEYDGSGLRGLAGPAGRRRTVQGELEAALARVTRERVRAVGSGRTDAGVHAEGQVASVRLETALDARALRRALNAVLPEDVAVRERRGGAGRPSTRATTRSGKLYRYSLWNAPDRSPLRAAPRAVSAAPARPRAIRRAAAQLVGSHDFASFQAAGSQVTSSVRTLRRLDVTGAAGSAPSSSGSRAAASCATWCAT